jgi:hypothetical protein
MMLRYGPFLSIAVMGATWSCGPLYTPQQAQQADQDLICRPGTCAPDGGNSFPVDGGVVTGCPSDQGTVISFTREQLSGLMDGRWAFCGGTYPLYAGGGIEFDSDAGTFYVLNYDGGVLERAAGFNASGTWAVATAPAAPQQVDAWNQTHDRNYLLFMAFTQNPSVMQADPGLQDPPRYVPIR